VLTSREIGRMIKQAGIDFLNLPEEEADSVLGNYAGAGTIFGATGGVMEAALRTAHHLVTGQKLEKVEFENVRGLKGVKEATIQINGMDIRVAVAHGLGNVETVLNKVRESKANGGEPAYHFIEVMACPGGCVGGGGQHYGVTDTVRAKRAKGLYSDDSIQKIRCSHENPFVQELYRKYLDKPLSEKAEELLHTNYKPRPVYNK
jgi:NADH-quinone oxidoreductase subunit G